MSVLLILLLLVVAVAVGYLVYQSSEDPQPPPDPETELKTSLRLHTIRRKLDVADLKHQQRQDAIRLRRELRQTLEEEE